MARRAMAKYSQATNGATCNSLGNQPSAPPEVCLLRAKAFLRRAPFEGSSPSASPCARCLLWTVKKDAATSAGSPFPA
eukprot:283072-Alexandrium_andersonii.AAC.1